jgi:hypothetical protein
VKAPIIDRPPNLPSATPPSLSPAAAIIQGLAGWGESKIIFDSERISLCQGWHSKSLRVEDLDATSGQRHQTSLGKRSQISGDNFPGGTKVSGDGFVGLLYSVFRIGGPQQVTAQPGLDGQRL